MNKVQLALLMIGGVLLSGCSGYIPYGTAALEIDDRIDFEVNTFRIIQSNQLQTSYENHFSQRLLDRFRIKLGRKLRAYGLTESAQPDIELVITEFSLMNRELVSLTFDIVSQGKKYRTVQYRRKVGPGYSREVTYFKWTPGMNKAADIVADSLRRRFKL